MPPPGRTPLGRGQAASDVNWHAPASGYGAPVKGGVALAPVPYGTDGTLENRRRSRPPATTPCRRPSGATTTRLTAVDVRLAGRRHR
ncbi:hypothetical protein ACH47Z_33590 [Streptomyces sp. NPDC020192]|uniref:hypothetical protein n=1 Tax=Streptomyces sp. NPDC020192 TaxID=3365066 RepID=UPI00378A355B